MTQRPLFQAQILEKLGSPLIAAAGGLNPAGGAPLAETLAALMGLAAQTAVAIGKSLNLADDDPQAEPIRLALMAVSAKLLAEQARLTKQTPGAPENQALTGALDAILKFSESFADAGARLDTLDGQSATADATQIKLQTLYALSPIVNAVTAAPLGQTPEDFLKDLVPKLKTRAGDMRAALGLAHGGEEIELHLLRALCLLYAACHADAQAIGGGTPESVWHAFTTRATMLEILGGNLGPVTAKDEAPAAPAPTPPPAAAPAPVGNPANPMSFFKPGAKKPDKPAAPPAGEETKS